MYRIYGQCYGGAPAEKKTQFDYHKNELVLKAPSRKEVVMIDGQPKTYRKFMTAKDYTPWYYKKLGQNKPQGEENLGDLPPCTFGEPLIAYLNNETIRKQLNIPADAPAWDMCMDGIDYVEGTLGSQFIWEKLRGKYRMLKYSGDQDGCVPTRGTLGWISALGWETKKEWRQWKVDGKNNAAGWVWNLDGLDFMSVHGAGHMVPQDQRESALFMLNSFISQTGPFAP
jgi:hypothetical protein